MSRRTGPCGRTLYHHAALLDLLDLDLHRIVEHLRLHHERAYPHRDVARTVYPAGVVLLEQRDELRHDQLRDLVRVRVGIRVRVRVRIRVRDRARVRVS